MTETTSPRFFTQADADPKALDGHRVAVIGYGTLGRSVAQNLRDSGVDVLVGNIADGYREQAEAEGFAPLDLGEAAAQADEVFVLLPDEVIPDCFDADIAPRIRPGAAVCFASGYVLAFGLVNPPPNVDVVLIAPRMSGALVRQAFLTGEGFYSAVSVEADVSGEAQDRMLGLAAAMGSLRRGVFELPAAKEALLDLLIEQTFGVYLGLGVQLAFRIGVEAGLPPEAMVLELYMSGEMAKTIEAFANEGFFASLTNHGLTALFGGFIRTADVDGDAMERMFRSALEDIQGGGFARRFQRELADGYPTVKVIQEMIGGGDPISAAESRVRAALDGKAQPSPAANTPVTRDQVAAWVAAYERAWRSPGTGALAGIFTPDATYLQGPYEEPVHGLDAIARMWEATREGPDEVFEMTSHVVAVDGDTAIVRAQVRYGDPVRQEYRDLWLMRFAPDGRCASFEEWPFWPGRPYTASP